LAQGLDPAVAVANRNAAYDEQGDAVDEHLQHRPQPGQEPGLLDSTRYRRPQRELGAGPRA